MEQVLKFIMFFLFFGFGFYNLKKKFKKYKSDKQEELENAINENEQLQKNYQKNNQIATQIKEAKIKKVDILETQLFEAQKLIITHIGDFKKTIIDNEKLIIEKGGDNQLFSFMKIDSFLFDFRGRIVEDQNGLNQVLDIDWLKLRITEDCQRVQKLNDLDKLMEKLNDASARLENGRANGFEDNLNKLFDLGNVMKPAIENQIKTMEFYISMAMAMVTFYLNDKKIRYFEIYVAFEKLGVFDSTWQKNVLNKLDDIDKRLAQIGNQLTELNQNFISLVESSEVVVSELKQINSSIMTNNLIQSITAYQAWRINKNTRSLKQ